MRLLRLAAAVVLSAALVAASGVAASAADDDGVCTITVQLPATAESGQPFTMHVVEDAACAGVSGLRPFTSQYLTDDDATLRWGWTGIDLSHVPGTGDASYRGMAPNTGTWRPLLRGPGPDAGYEVVLTTMVTTPQVTPTPTTPSAKAVWVNDTLRITYPHVVPAGVLASDAYWSTYVDGQRVALDEYTLPGRYGAVEVPRAASAGPAEVRIVATSVADITNVQADTDTLVYSRTVARRAVRAERGQVSAAALLRTLEVADETRAGSYRASRFGRWVDADRDGRDARAEVLAAESLRKPVLGAHGAVRSGRWTSRYDRTTVTDPSRLVVDHLVPLGEAWTSGAAGWSAKKRSAYANDLGYGPSLIAVSRAAIRAKAGRDVVAHLPSSASYRCAYVKHWIAVKHRWGLTVDPVEKNTLLSDLTLYCGNPFVARPSSRR